VLVKNLEARVFEGQVFIELAFHAQMLQGDQKPTLGVFHEDRGSRPRATAV
jgi:hypothetical protein